MMVEHDPSLYREIEIYYDFVEKDNQFSEELVDLLKQDGSKSSRILQSTSGKV
jgi:hypothetical protein